ncbi:MAG: NAD(P)H-dependent oxidoreductase, partial [Pseudomonadales bacterium]|nr:NAD(P)H-dependent oxidoreductase [Pseudomonadales bacterium]NRA15068.1 NAD(P)H-dependent oxidoreductase [Oceanospirillaceae bacterium]
SMGMRQFTKTALDRLKYFLEKIASADALVISFAEHNGFYSAAYKNIFDWASRINMKVFQDKPMLIMSASIGPNGGASVLNAANQSAPFFGALIKASFCIGKFHQKFDIEVPALTDTELSLTLRQSLQSLVQG